MCVSHMNVVINKNNIIKTPMLAKRFCWTQNRFCYRQVFASSHLKWVQHKISPMPSSIPNKNNCKTVHHCMSQHRMCADTLQVQQTAVPHKKDYCRLQPFLAFFCVCDQSNICASLSWADQTASLTAGHVNHTNKRNVSTGLKGGL